ncbi:MAG: hypothetical protein AAF589_03765 [Planctomycetota bacterium]
MAPPRSQFRHVTWLALLLAAMTAGCSPYMRTPNLLHPGPAGPQRTDAIYHDPYPLDDVGPEIVGGRPRGYQRPVPETLRGRLLETQPATIVPAF